MPLALALPGSVRQRPLDLTTYTLVARRVWKRFNHGLQSAGKLQVYTTYGAGTWGPPFRVATQPEIVLLTFAA